MATNFPAAVDTASDPTATTQMNAAGALAHHAQHTTANDAIAAIETLIGTQPSTTAPMVPATTLYAWRYFG